MSSQLYLVGAVLVAAGLIYAAYSLHVPPKWNAAITIILAGVAILKTAKTTPGGWHYFEAVIAASNHHGQV